MTPVRPEPVSSTVRAPLLRKTLRDNARGIAGWTLGIVALVAVQLSVFPSVSDTTSKIVDFAEAFPEVFRKIFRLEDYGSAVGYLSTELFSASLPLIFIAVGVTWGARVATDELEQGTSDVLYSLPLSRAHVMWVRLAAMVGVLIFLGVIVTVSLAIGGPIVDMSIAISRLAAASVSIALAGLIFGSLAAFVGAASGRRSVALGIGLTVAIACFVVYSLAPIVEVMDDVNPYNPMQWTIGAESLKVGFDVWSCIFALATSIVPMIATIIAFDRRDLAA